MQNGAQFEVRDGRIVLGLGKDQWLDVTDALVVSMNMETPTVDVTRIGDMYAKHLPTGELRVTLDMVLTEDARQQGQPQAQPAAPEQPQESTGPSKRVLVPPEGQRRSQRILGRSRGDR